MRRLHIWVGTALLAVVGSTAGVMAPAAADTLAFKDPTGDAMANYDLTKVSVRNGVGALSVISSVSDLRGGPAQIFGVNVMPAGESASYSVQAVRRRNGAIVTRLLGYGDAVSTEVECAVRSRWKLGKDTIVTSIPRTCLGEVGRISVSAYLGRGDGTAGDPSDWTKAVAVAPD